MTIARLISGIRHEENSVVTIGTFDGVHLGHQAILREVTARARARGGRSVVVSFDPHPRDVVGRGPVRCLTTLDERLALIAGTGIDAAVVLEFTYEFSRQSPDDFYRRYVVEGTGVAEVVEGFDHMFGRDREAGVESLRELGRRYGFQTLTVPPVMIADEAVSSSSIREKILAGDVAGAAEFLGRPYAISGTVVRGDGRGKEIGFPTANVGPAPDNKVVPANGVYFVRVSLAGGEFPGMANIGVRPTFRDDARRTIEVHLFDRDGDLYGEPITVGFLRRLREERKFSSAQELVRQLKNDKEMCLGLIKESANARVV